MLNLIFWVKPVVCEQLQGCTGVSIHTHLGPEELSSSPAAAVPWGSSSFWIQSLCPGRGNVEIVVMSDPTISSSALLSWPRDATLICYRHKQHRNSTLASCGPAQAKVGGAMNTNAQTDRRQSVGLFWFHRLCVYFPSFSNAGNGGRRTFSRSAWICNS